MATKPVASIILPYRNSASTLNRCLESIISQDFGQWELLAVNDHSDLESIKILKEFSRSDQRIIPINSYGKGICASLNSGIMNARSDIIIRMDSDDAMKPNRIREQVNFLEDNSDIGLIASKVSYLVDKNSLIDGRGYASYVEWLNGIVSFNEIEINQFEESPFAHPSVAFRKSLVDDYGGYKEGDFPEDYELWLRWLSKGVKMQKLQSNLLDWYDSKNRLSRQDTRYSQNAFQYVKAIYLSLWLKKEKFSDKKVSAWGVGKVARKQTRHLLNQKIKISRFYEVDPKKIGLNYQGSQICSIDEISNANDEIILVLCGTRDAKNTILKFMNERGLKQGNDFLFL